MGHLMLNNYELVLKSKYLGKIPVEVYKSRRTGLHVAFADVAGPIVSSHLVLITETETDDGLPHTLEHLVFMGSKTYPFKGALDLLAMKAFSVGGTNAWTEQDHTSYTVKTIGESGMQQFIAVYGDHLINPILSDENYRSEVYNVTATGEETGVVYSEIQDNENNLDNLVSIESKHKIFLPSCPSLSSSSGGRMREVRELCSLKRVQDYHKKYYHLKNMWILLSGAINKENMLKNIDILDSAPENKPPETFERPFIGMKVPDITRNRNDLVTINGPCESNEGVVEISFLGKPAWDLEFCISMQVLSYYLTTTSSAPLKRELVLISDPYCDSVSLAIEELPLSKITAEFSGVPVEKLEQLPNKFFEVLRTSTTVDTLDIDRIRSIIDFKIKKLYAKVEKDSSKSIFHNLIGFQLFAQRLDDQAFFEKSLNHDVILRELRQKRVKYWADLAKEVFTDNAMVVLGRPDSKLGEKIAKEEAERLEKLKEQAIKRQKMGEEERKIEDASSCPNLKNSFNNISYDPKISTFKVDTSILSPAKCRNGHPELIANLPFTTFIHDVDSKFLKACFIFDLRNLPIYLLKHLMLFDSILSKSPALVDNKLLSDVEVSNLMTKELMDVTFGVGVVTGYSHIYGCYFEVSNNEFHLIPRWLRIFLKDTIFKKDKLLAILKNSANGASSQKRNGSSMLLSVLRSLDTVKEHPSRFYDKVVLEQYNRDLAKKLEDSDGDVFASQLIDELNQLRDAILTAPLNFHLICNSKELSADIPMKSDVWDFINQGKSSSEKITFDLEKDLLAFQLFTPTSRVLKVEACDASFLYGKINLDKIEYQSQTNIALEIMCEYFSTVEGILWNSVRGKGYAYGVAINFAFNSMCLRWDLYRASRPKLAYEEMRTSVLDVFNDETKLDKALFDLSKRAAISANLSRYETLNGTALMAAFDSFHKRSISDVKNLCDGIWKANLSDVFKLAKPHFEKLFQEDTSIVGATCPRNKLGEIQETFPNMKEITIKDLQYVPE